jgi:predicted phosphodiesterase
MAALEAVLADLGDSAPDLVVNLGDHVSGPLHAAATADLLMGQTGWVQIRGNHDRQLVQRRPEEMGLSDRAASGQLSARHRAWLAALPVTARPWDGVLLCHGTPEHDCEYLIEDVSQGFARPRAFKEAPAALVLCGHSHVPRVVQARSGALLANPGSVGLQAYADPEHRHPHVIENGSPHPRYLLLDRTPQGWRATLRMVPHDEEPAARLAAGRGRPEWAHALRTGWAAPA